ncbi:MAG: HD domain-containing protein [Chloroherpetonaceae bacterium]|nr:HD domain-containing protein [Chloroherpetonaceae bacterium]
MIVNTKSFHLAVFGKPESGFIRIPVWGHIPLSEPLKAVLSHPAFLRLKGIRQLSFAHHVFPGATHTRFEHSIGVYHLTKLILERLVQSPFAKALQSASFRFDEEACRTILASALLHDIGHYPHAHIVERIPLNSKDEIIFQDHQELTKHFLFEKGTHENSLADILKSLWKVNPVTVAEMIKGEKKLPFSKIISGTLDPDKMDYLMRDAHHCNIPYGEIDIHRLIESFVPDAKHKRLAITEKGVAPLESLMFAKYMMMRNVYWHHTTRTFSLMLKRLLQDALDEGAATPDALRSVFYPNSDERLLTDLNFLFQKKFNSRDLLSGLMDRRPYKRIHEIGESELPEMSIEQMRISAAIRKKKEIEISTLLQSQVSKREKATKLNSHLALIDIPSRKNIFDHHDFKELQLYKLPPKFSQVGKEKLGTFVPFDQSGVSAFTTHFISEFEASSRMIRVLVAPVFEMQAVKNIREIRSILCA